MKGKHSPAANLSPLTMDFSYPLAIVLCCLFICLTILFERQRIGRFIWRKGDFRFEGNETADESTWALLDATIDTAETNHTRRLLNYAFYVFQNNETGKNHAIYVAAINHCLKDIAAIGLDNYIENLKNMGKWSTEETRQFAKCMLLSCRELLASRINAYQNAMKFVVADSFRSVLAERIKQDATYQAMLLEYMTESHLITKTTLLDYSQDDE